jgi:rhodanese-related sulfurtransferase
MNKQNNPKPTNPKQNNPKPTNPNSTYLLNKLNKYISNTKSDWNYITPVDFYNKYWMDPSKNGSYLLLDLRKKDVYDQGHIKGAKNIYWLDLLKKSNLKYLEKHSKKVIFLICYVGHTSSQAMVLLKLLGYKVVSIKFGYGISPDPKVLIAGWINYGYPIETSIKTSKSNSQIIGYESNKSRFYI